MDKIIIAKHAVFFVCVWVGGFRVAMPYNLGVGDLLASGGLTRARWYLEIQTSAMHSCSPSRRNHDRVHAPHHWREVGTKERERGGGLRRHGRPRPGQVEAKSRPRPGRVNWQLPCACGLVSLVRDPSRARLGLGRRARSQADELGWL